MPPWGGSCDEYSVGSASNAWSLSAPSQYLLRDFNSGSTNSSKLPEDSGNWSSPSAPLPGLGLSRCFMATIYTCNIVECKKHIKRYTIILTAMLKSPAYLAGRKSNFVEGWWWRGFTSLACGFETVFRKQVYKIIATNEILLWVTLPWNNNPSGWGSRNTLICFTLQETAETVMTYALWTKVARRWLTLIKKILLFHKRTKTTELERRKEPTNSCTNNTELGNRRWDTRVEEAGVGGVPATANSNFLAAVDTNSSVIIN